MLHPLPCLPWQASLEPGYTRLVQPFTPTHAGAEDVERLSDLVPSRSLSSDAPPGGCGAVCLLPAADGFL